MGTYKFIKDYVSPNAKDTQAKQKDTKYRPTDQQTLQAIVDILFDGNVDNESNITINGLREDFSGKCHFTVINDCVLIDYVDIFHAVYKPVHGENTRRAMGKFIEHFKQLKDKYTIKVISRPGGEVINGIGSEPTLIISGFTEEELDILRGNSAIPNRLINIGYNNHKFALIEKEAKPGSNYIIFDDIKTMLNYKESIKDQYGIESEVYHIDTNNFDLEKVNIYGKLYERYYFTSESLPMVKVEFKPSDDFITKSVFEDIIIISGCYNSDNIDYQREIDNFIKNFGGKDINGFTPTSIDVYLSGGYDDYIFNRKGKPIDIDEILANVTEKEFFDAFTFKFFNKRYREDRKVNAIRLNNGCVIHYKPNPFNGKDVFNCFEGKHINVKNIRPFDFDAKQEYVWELINLREREYFVKVEKNESGLKIPSFKSCSEIFLTAEDCEKYLKEAFENGKDTSGIYFVKSHWSEGYHRDFYKDISTGKYYTEFSETNYVTPIPMDIKF